MFFIINFSVYCAYTNSVVRVSADIYALIGDNPRQNEWCHTNSSCTLFCRKCKVSLFFF